MSKSRGTFISARAYLDQLDPAFLRYYYCCKINNTTDDVDLNLADFAQRVNSDLVGKITNLASRGAQMLQKRLGGKTGALDAKGAALLADFRAKAPEIAALYEARKFSQIPVEICHLADAANEYFDAAQPWNTIKTDPEATRQTLTSILALFRVLAIYLKPVLPEYAAKAERLLGDAPWTWDSIADSIENREIAPYEYLAARVDPEAVERMVEASKIAAPLAPGARGFAPAPAPSPAPPVPPPPPFSYGRGFAPAPDSAPPVPPLKPQIGIAAFEPLDLRVALVEKAEPVEGSDKLVRFALDLGPLGKRTIFSGIRAAYPDPSVLDGTRLVVLANLKPREMRFGVSEGMILSAGAAPPDFRVLAPAGDALPGDPIG
jgi:methionyl-tRNA synthetase